MTKTMDDVLKIGPRITVLPIVNGSGDFAWEVRRIMLENKFDCLAVPLPESFRQDIEAGIDRLPTPTIVLQKDYTEFDFSQPEKSWTPDSDSDSEDETQTGETSASYVPVDPCQPVIAAIRTAIGERIPRVFVDMETSSFESYGQMMPDSFSLKRVAIEKFSAAILPVIRKPDQPQRIARINYMASRLKELCETHESILFICNVLDWPWIRDTFNQRQINPEENESVNETNLFSVANQTLYFHLGELPYITSLYEKARSELDSDQYLSIDGIKNLLLTARDAYQSDFKGRARKITPHLLATCLKYLRNITLLNRRFTPDLPDIVTAAQQVFGDQFALHVFETAKTYRYDENVSDLTEVRMGIEQTAFPDGSVAGMTNRLPGVPMTWRSLSIKKKPDEKEIEKWQQQWNPYQQCSWPAEDELIENFRQSVLDRAEQILGNDLAKTEKFTSSIKDGIDIRDTLRHWYEGEIYVKVLPPNRGNLDCAVMLFDSPADPRDYPWRTTWYAEHENESTLAFYATNFGDNPVGPGICLASYGGALFLFPPRQIPDIWTDPRLDFTETLEERILAAGCLHAKSKTIALLSAIPPGPGWRRLAKRFGKTLVHLPMGQFSSETIAQLRYVHVLNGHQVRSYAASFIRKA